MRLEREVEKKPPYVEDRRFPKARREYDKFAKELAKRAGVDRATLEETISTYGLDVAVKAAEMEPRAAPSSKIAGLVEKIKKLWARR